MVIGSDDWYGTVRLDGSTLGSMRGNDADDVRSHALQGKGPSARNRTAIDEIGEGMRRNKARNDIIFNLQQKVVRLDIHNIIAQFDRPKDVFLADLEIARIT